MLKRNISSALSSLALKRCPLWFPHTSVRLLCSPPSPLPDQSLRTLTDMGFTDTQAEEIHMAVSSLKGGRAVKNVTCTLGTLFAMGLNSHTVLKLLQKCPELYTIKDTQLQQRISNLRKLGLGEGSMQRTVSHYPKILTVPVKNVKNTVQFLREKCLFTTQQLTDILRDCPAVVMEDPSRLEYKFQYVYFRMGVKQAEMVKHRLFRFTMDDVRCRHTFLERRGLYQTPDKKGQTLIINPTLDAILHVDRNDFLTQVANASAEEFEVFEKLLLRESQEEELQQGRIQADGDDEYEEDNNDDSDEDDDRETEGRSGYRKKKKR
uniref:Transcription termination factor 4, mitochondrial-like n=3 Tax=Gouania willdenowi TaxID=441366 RepID=A0A8C5GIW7_GOUWI